MISRIRNKLVSNLKPHISAYTLTQLNKQNITPKISGILLTTPSLVFLYDLTPNIIHCIKEEDINGLVFLSSISVPLMIPIYVGTKLIQLNSHYINSYDNDNNIS